MPQVMFLRFLTGFLLAAGLCLSTRADEVSLTVDKGPLPDQVTLEWIGGLPVFEIFRNSMAESLVALPNVVATTDQQSHVDTLASDGIVYFQVTSPCVCLIEICDGIDNDCNGTTDDKDYDNDGYIDVACGGVDCDDTQPLVNPGTPELCGDGIDNDCNGIPEDRDFDGDGFIDERCGGTDCHDLSDTTYPGAVEICGDGLDNDCDTLVDNADMDGDGYIDLLCGGTDCNDLNDTVYEGAEELCDSLDNDCDSVTDNRDVDEDGYLEEACSGTDCDDADAAVHPGAAEICGNLIDEDCSGNVDDADSDNDSYIATACGGTDCDDTRDTVHPGAMEIADAHDNDCNGLVDEGLVPVGAVIITELMADPNATADTSGEWFEVYNTTSAVINLDSWIIRDDGADLFVVQAPAGLNLDPGQSVVFCNEDNPVFNGGVSCDYVYGGLLLGNFGDEIVLTLDGLTIDRVDYGPSFPIVDGRSMSLDPSAHDSIANDAPSNWCPTPTDPSYQLSGGDYGTPGDPNPNCF